MLLMIDNYDSFTYNLVHLVAQFDADLQVVRNDKITLGEIEVLAPRGIVISPGPGRPADAGLTMPVIETFGAQTPIFGVCLGHQAIGQVYGGTVTYADSLMHGKTSTIVHHGLGVFAGVQNEIEATRYHSLVVDAETLPDVLEPTAWTRDGVLMGVRHRTLPVEGVQFHPESVMTPDGARMIEQWVSRLG